LERAYAIANFVTIKAIVYDHEAFRFAFLPQKPRGYASGDRPIYLRITVDGTVTELSIQQSCDPANWNANAYRQ
jgi:hypothetical protein